MNLVFEEAQEIYKTIEKYPFQKETFETIGLCMEVHKQLGRGFLEIVYKDALLLECVDKSIPFEREKKFEIEYKGKLLSHFYVADFILFNNIILEIKAQDGVVEEHYKQVINYLAVSKLKVGLLVNFGEDSLKFKRIIL
jgi:GxxExxY protein